MVGMTASAPEFVPSRPLQAKAATATANGEEHDMDNGEDNEDDNEPSSSHMSAASASTVGTASSSQSRPVNNRKRPLANPSMVPQAPRIPKTAAEKETSRRLYIVLSQACLETYQISSGGGSGAARRDGRYDSGEARYTLLNCDDHVGYTQCWPEDTFGHAHTAFSSSSKVS